MAEETTTAPSSSASQGASATTAAAGSQVQGAASQQAQSSQASTTTQATDAAAVAAAAAAASSTTATDRPAWVPEKYWDAAAKSVKGDDFAAHYNELQARIAADDLRKAAIPAAPDAYKFELPKDFAAPQGVEFKFNDADPNLAMARQVMHEIDSGKLSGQEAFSKLLGLYAGAQVSQASTIETARLAEISKLGPTATARIDAIERFWNAYEGDPTAGKATTSRLFTAADVQREEKRIAKIMGGGASSFTSGTREPPPKAGVKSDAEIAKMSAGERLDYARSFNVPKGGRAA